MYYVSTAHVHLNDDIKLADIDGPESFVRLNVSHDCMTDKKQYSMNDNVYFFLTSDKHLMEPWRKTFLLDKPRTCMLICEASLYICNYLFPTKCGSYKQTKTKVQHGRMDYG
jgi:hypothetical protein